ncbi:SDR family oxidoreductase [Amycolatopsis rhabdoformis]|uniref:SDR family oxidoreductase n=1 Tax=Amycolatopsis rhabdoformis TaxID=1448059 RepID=A0ABZ1HWP1_9PSEU|nr:SDR family oxidoreductase [Amycolatopsis rhabdoformis]WSE26580.1 SDR family oxidoreductase [Amycolatopsis rhabdoformis]
MPLKSDRPVALITGVGRRAGIGAAIAERLGADGWAVACSSWQAYDARMPWGPDPVRVGDFTVEADLADPATPARLFDEVTAALGPVSALVLAHCESVDSGFLDTTLESFDRHFAVNTRAAWLLMREFGTRHAGGEGRIVALTSDDVVGNVPYGASKGALDRLVVAAAAELGSRGITANSVNPGPTDTGWLDGPLSTAIRTRTPLGRLGTPRDCANLVSFLCGPDGGWVTGQVLTANGGLT